MTTKEILQKARDLLAQPGKWGQGAYACDADGNIVKPNSDAACRFCALGAVYHVMGLEGPTREGRPEPLSILYKAYGAEDGLAYAVNDEAQSVEPVLAIYDKAIALCD